MGCSSDGEESTPPTLTEAAFNVTAEGSDAFVALGPAGVAGLDASTGELLFVAEPTGGLDAVHDIATDRALVVGLDADEGSVQAWVATADGLEPAGSAVAVDVGPFAGVSTSRGRVVVSGGTGLLSVLTLDFADGLSGPISTIDLGVGQPDVLLDPDRPVAYVSTDFAGVFDGQTFGISVVDLQGEPVLVAQIGLEGAGFSAGTLGPANFPIETALVDQVLMVAHGGGLSLIDVSDAVAAEEITTFDLGFEAISVDADDARAYVVSGEAGAVVATIDIEDPAAPGLLGTTALILSGGQATGVAVVNGSVLVSTTNDGVFAFDRAALE